MNRMLCREYELIYVIVNAGNGSKILHFSKSIGITGGTVMLGQGTVKNRLLEFLELNKVRKEIVLMGAEKKDAHTAMEKMNDKFGFYKKNHGIAFSIPIVNILGAELLVCDKNDKKSEVHDPMYQSIFVIVDRGKAEAVIDAAVKAGSRGGTIICGRGSGIHETSKLFAMEIEPEKEIVLIISEKDATDRIASTIQNDLEIDQPGNGIIFIQNVSKAYGLY